MVVDAISNYDEMVSIEKNKINFEKRKRTKEISNQHIFIFWSKLDNNITVYQSRSQLNFTNHLSFMLSTRESRKDIQKNHTNNCGYLYEMKHMYTWHSTKVEYC